MIFHVMTEYAMMSVVVLHSPLGGLWLFMLCGGICHGVDAIIMSVSVLWCYVTACTTKLSLLLRFLFCDVAWWNVP